MKKNQSPAHVDRRQSELTKAEELSSKKSKLMSNAVKQQKKSQSPSEVANNVIQIQIIDNDFEGEKLGQISKP